jgi:hypothetical protein
MHKIDAPAYHPTTFKRTPRDVAQLVVDLPSKSVYRNGARVRAKNHPSSK